jgi:uncharacterized membrane protein YbhN (UPF0104 family)
VRWIVQGVLFVALAAGIFGVLPRLGGLTRDAAGLRHARPGFLVAAVVVQAASLGCYALLYRQVLTALGARVRFRLTTDVTLARNAISGRPEHRLRALSNPPPPLNQTELVVHVVTRTRF